MAINPLLAAIDNPDYREGENALVELVAGHRVFPSLYRIAVKGKRSDVKRAGVQVELLVLFKIAPAGEEELRILNVAKTKAGVRRAATLEESWGAKPVFQASRLKQRLREWEIKHGTSLLAG
jgi:hypothetical protein